MPPTLILIRHAQALHNVGSHNEKDQERGSIHDPVLTEVGVRSLAVLRDNLMADGSIARDAGVIITSPMKRTIQTALESLDWLIKGGILMEADADWQENSAKPCDTGTPLNALQEDADLLKYGLYRDQASTMFTSLDPLYPDKTTPAGARYAYTKEAILNRGQTALAKLYQRKEKVIIVVSHSGFLRAGVTGCWFQNADYRIFDFEERKGELDPYRLQEHRSTTPAGGLGLSRTDPVPLGSGLPG